jgi:DNA-binding transcriptional ArsR family regulator
MNYKRARHPVIKTTQERILEVLCNGPLTWDEIQEKLHTEERAMGFALSELFYEKKLHTELKGETRTYRLRT